MDNYEELAKKFRDKNHKKLSFNEIKKELERIIDNDNEKYIELAENYTHADWYKEMEKIIGPIKMVEQVGGSDQGSYWYSVLNFIDHNVFIKITGYYTSYEGTSFTMFDTSDFKEVFPSQKTITIYS
jgi:hypothetical protein